MKLTNVTKACEKDGETQAMIHHILDLKDRNGKKHKIKCIHVDHITDRQEQVNLNIVHKIFPHIPKGALTIPPWRSASCLARMPTNFSRLLEVARTESVISELEGQY